MLKKKINKWLYEKVFTLLRWQASVKLNYISVEGYHIAYLEGVLKGASKKLPHSDIIKSLNDISKHIIQPSKAKKKVILLVSDMIEHSSITTFYTKGLLKKVNTDSEMAKVKSSGHLANFTGADVYVLGAGIIGKKGYRDSKTLKMLTSFWESYFSSTHANLKEFGTPMLLEDIE